MKYFSRFVLLFMMLISTTMWAANKFAVANGNWSATATWSLTRGGASGAAVPAQGDSVIIPSPYTVTVDASGKVCKSLTVESGATIYGNVALPTSSIKYIRVYNGIVTIDGTLGTVAGDCLAFECSGTVTFKGSGTIKPARIRPRTDSTNVNIIIDCDMTAMYTGTSGTGGMAIYTANTALNDNITITVNSGRTLTLMDLAYFGTASSVTADGTGSSTFNINGTLIQQGIGASTNLRVSTGKTCTLNIGNGASMSISRNLNASQGAGSTSIVNNGSLTVGSGGAGTADFSTPSVTMTGTGTFTLPAGASINIGAVSGLDPVNGQIKTTTRSFSTAGNYLYSGTAAQSTGSDLPATVGTLTINNASGITLTNNTSIDSTMTITNGTLSLGAGVLSYNAVATLVYNGSAAQTTTSAEFPATGGPTKLTINNAAGVSLHASRSLDSALTFSNGKLTTSTNSITVKGSVKTAGSGKFVEGNLIYPVSAASVKKWELGQSTDYIPFTAGFNSVTGSDNISVTALDRNTVSPLGQFTSSNKLLRRYFRVTKGSGITAFGTDSLVLSYTNADVLEQGVGKDTLRVFKYDGVNWSAVNISGKDTSANTITVTGVNSFSDFVIAGANMSGISSFSSRTVAFGNLTVGFSKTDSSVVVTNNGATSLNITSITSNDPDLTVLPVTSTIASAASQKFYLKYAPSAEGNDIDTLVFTSNGMTTSDTVFVTGSGVLPTLTLSAAGKSYGNVLQGSSKKDSVNVTNTGTGTLVISTVASDNADFVVTPNANITLLPTETQKFYVTFTPSTVATKTGNIIFTYNNTVESPDTLAVDGVGSVPGFGLSTYLVDFGKLRKSKTKMDSVTVANTGAIDLNISAVTSDVADFTVTPTSATVTPSTNKTFYITFAPTSVGLQTANIRFAHDGSKPADTVVAKGTGIMPVYTASRITGDFGDVNLGRSKTDSLYIKNTGTDTLHLDSLHHSRSEFTWVMTGKTQYAIAPGDSNKSVVTFTPLGLGAVKDTFITFNDGANLRDTTYALGNGVQALFASSPKSIVFGSVILNVVKKDSVTVTNSGTGTLQIDSIKTDNAMFTVTPATGSIAVAGTGKFYISFTPTSAGAKTGNVFFYHDGKSLKDTVTVSGSGIQAVFSASKKTVLFGGVVMTQTKKDSVFVTNTGNSQLTISSVASNSIDFAITPVTAVIDTGKSQRFLITFNPSAVGVRTGSIVFNHNASTKDTVAVSGQGIPVTTIKAARAAANGSEVAFEGLVTRVKGSYTYMQDDSAGIIVYQSSGIYRDTVAGGYIKKGDKIRIHGKTSEYNSLKEIAAADLMDFSILSHNNTMPAPKVVTLAQLKAGGEVYEARLIRVPSITIVTTDSLFAAAKTYSVTDPTDTTKAVALRTPNAADGDIDSLAILKKLVTFTGVLGQFNSSNPAAGYQLMAIDSSDITDNVLIVRDLMDMMPTEYQLAQNYPNPFNPSTMIQYGLPKQSSVTIKIYSILGQEVRTLVNDVQSPSYYRISWNGTDNNGNHLSSGVYFIRITAQSSEPSSKPFIQVKKMLLMK